jgi:hypothetical protein
MKLQIIVTVLIVIGSFFAFMAWDSYGEESYTKPAPATKVVEPKITPAAFQAQCCMVRHIHPGEFSRYMTEDFMADRLRREDSRGRSIPAKMVNRLNSWAAKKVEQGVRVHYWWRKEGRTRTLNRAECMANIAPNSFSPLFGNLWCLRNADNPGVRRLNKNITGIKVVCGGSAVVGAVAGGGWVGAGKGAASCLWSWLGWKVYNNRN